MSYTGEGRHVVECCADCGVWVQTDRARVGLPVRTGMLTRVKGITPSMRHVAIDRSGGRCEVCGREVGSINLETRFVVAVEVAEAEGWSLRTRRMVSASEAEQGPTDRPVVKPPQDAGNGRAP